MRFPPPWESIICWCEPAFWFVIPVVFELAVIPVVFELTVIPVVFEFIFKAPGVVHTFNYPELE